MKARVVALRLDPDGNAIIELRFDDAIPGLYQSAQFMASKLVDPGTPLTLGMVFGFIVEFTERVDNSIAVHSDELYSK